MSKVVNNLITYLRKKADPAIVKLDALRQGVKSWRQLQGDAGDYNAGLKAKREALAQTYFQKPTLENLIALANAEQERAAFHAVYIETSASVGIIAEAQCHTLESITILKDALEALASGLRTKINEVADEEKARLEKAGIDSEGEHPAIVALRQKLSEVCDGLAECRNCERGSDNRQSVWSKYNGLISL
jgi:hypothetical protein